MFLIVLFSHSICERRQPTLLKQIFEDDDVVAYKPRDDLWLLQTKQGIPVSIYVLEGTEKALVIDCDHIIKNFKDLIQKVTKKPFVLALSHGHIGHVGSINEFETIYMNKKDQNLIPNNKGKIEDIHHGYKFDLGDREIEVFDMEGHTEGSIGFLDKKGKFIVAGDAIGHNVIWMHITKVPLESLIGTLQYLISIKDQWTELYTGHFNEPNRPLDLRYVEDLLELTQKICYTKDYKAEPYEAHGFKLDFQPMIAYGNNGVGIIFNPNRLHYV
mgnify:CR=1 FL=1